MGMRDDDKFAARRAIEALRNGVPNGNAVQQIGCNQRPAEERFQHILDGARSDQAGLGMLISGDFGAGKSHLLAHFAEVANANGFVCSKVAISKETPLYDLAKVFVSAMDRARLPNNRGRLIEELANLARIRESEAMTRFRDWAHREGDEGRLSKIFPASLAVYQQSGDQELKNDIEAFWAGDRLLISKLRNGLRRIGKLQEYKFTAPKLADLPAQRLRFAVELIKSLGHRGWVVLIDEIELVGSYSVLQRGRSYAEIAQWMGDGYHERIPRLIMVGALTDDFASAIISSDGLKKDKDHVRTRLEASARHASLAPFADRGMRILETACLALDPPQDDDVQSTMARLRDLYSAAYGWSAPDHVSAVGGAGSHGRMRHKVRAAINEWDLRRLQPDYSPQIEIIDYETTYREEIDLDPAADHEGT